jgi:hypothetical protein
MNRLPGELAKAKTGPPGAMDCLPRRRSPERRRIVLQLKLAGAFFLQNGSIVPSMNFRKRMYSQVSPDSLLMNL